MPDVLTHFALLFALTAPLFGLKRMEKRIVQTFGEK